MKAIVVFQNLVRRLKFYDLIPECHMLACFHRHSQLVCWLQWPCSLFTLMWSEVSFPDVEVSEKGTDCSLDDTLRTSQALCLCMKMCKKTHIFEAKCECGGIEWKSFKVFFHCPMTVLFIFCIHRLKQKMEQLLVAKSDSAPVSQTRCRKFKVQKYYGFAFFIILELFFYQ